MAAASVFAVSAAAAACMARSLAPSSALSMTTGTAKPPRAASPLVSRMV